MLSAVLFAPEQYWRLTPAVRARLTNGCGAGGWLGQILVPDTMWFLNITPVCNIHDYMYRVGKTIADKEEADRVFQNNLVRWIDANTRWQWLRRLRYRRARIYFEAVEHFGGPAFWHNKNASEEMGTLTLAGVLA